ncbi:uncharacterized protein EAE97_001734 [Botrytis byssoidea]|uniref:Uncharacterized protein n=1 Tax=Botrytis byssoidea TaxID=139641 RepID=A0A9P5IWI8_9HELO|nr:uncharacterized protein EAE97_001734 [Botrytis byssoidea]KAF7952237.1 hypothetical protein EAE97_001734 [Botrytis byssoidea]
MENNNMTSTPQESPAIPAATMENQDQTATTSLQLSTPSTGTTMSNITSTNAVVAAMPSPAYIGRLPIELRLPIYNSLLCMTVAGCLPPILRAFHGTSEYPLLQYLYRLVNFILSNATLPIFWTITNRGKRLDKILYLHLRSDNFEYFRLEDDSRHLLKRHVCKLQNSFQKITFTAIQPTRTPHNSDELWETNTNVSHVLDQICDIVNASVQACEVRFKFLGYNNGNLDDHRYLYNFVGQVSRRLRVTRRWTPRRELVGDDGLVHDGIVWIWELV